MTNTVFMPIEGLSYMLDRLFPGIRPGVDYVCQCQYSETGELLADAEVVHWALSDVPPGAPQLRSLWDSTYAVAFANSVAEWEQAEVERKARVLNGSLIDWNILKADA